VFSKEYTVKRVLNEMKPKISLNLSFRFLNQR